MHLCQYSIYRTNDNTFVFNRILGYNTVLYDDVEQKWQFDRVNYFSATCYIKYSKNHYSYIQPVANHNEKNFIYTYKDGIIIKTSNVYSSPEILSGIYKNIIPHIV